MYTSSQVDPTYRVWLQDRLTSGVVMRRFIAWLIDIFVLGAVIFALWTAGMTFTVLTFGLGAPLMGAIAFSPLLYGFISLMSSLQASPGQAAMGLVVVRDEDLGEPTPFRALVFMICYTVTVAAGVIWCAVALVTTRHRTLHDMASGLVVVRRSALQSYLTQRPFA